MSHVKLNYISFLFPEDVKQRLDSLNAVIMKEVHNNVLTSKKTEIHNNVLTSNSLGFGLY